MRSAIFGAASSILLLANNSRAQEKPWEIALEVPSFNTYYQENFTNFNPESVQGNAFDAIQLHPRITYRARRQTGLPIFVTAEVIVPLLTVKRLETGSDYAPDGITSTTQKEQIAHTNLTGRVVLGWEMLSYLQPYVAIERSRFASERTGQVDGSDTGFSPDPIQDYTETVWSTQLGFGIQGAIPLNAKGDVRIRYDAGYEIPQSVFVSDTYFGAGAWGQGTTGYTISGRVELDIPFRIIADTDGYFTIGGLVSKREWNGNGSRGLYWNGDYAVNLTWPQNFTVEAGGFIGIGMFF
ncbi:MAG: hypothetical protein ACHQNE_02420 [Candidatus Kapaibacterium sp.]